jgi:ArsR family transcriptional regulator
MIAMKEQIADVYQEQAELHRALNHPVRLAILDILRDGEQCVCHMEAILGLRQAYISQHLMVLRDAGLVEDRRDGWNVFYRVSRREVYKVTDAMSAMTGGPARQIAHVHSATDCPCPKCNRAAEA